MQEKDYEEMVTGMLVMSDVLMSNELHGSAHMLRLWARQLRESHLVKNAIDPPKTDEAVWY